MQKYIEIVFENRVNGLVSQFSLKVFETAALLRHDFYFESKHSPSLLCMALFQVLLPLS